MVRFVTYDYCACRPDETYQWPPAVGPEFYDDRDDAFRAFARAKLNPAKYWAVHFEGKHVKSVVFEDPISREEQEFIERTLARIV